MYGGRVTWTRTLGKDKFGVVFKKANDAAYLLLNTLKNTTVSIQARAILWHLLSFQVHLCCYL